jgi:hypothetical protein
MRGIKRERGRDDRKLLETHNHEIVEMRNGNKELVVKIEKLSEAVNNDGRI